MEAELFLADGRTDIHDEINNRISQFCEKKNLTSKLYYSVIQKRWAQTAYLLKLVIQTTNALPRWRVNVETKTKRTLQNSRRLGFNELTNAKTLVLHSSHFALN